MPSCILLCLHLVAEIEYNHPFHIDPLTGHRCDCYIAVSCIIDGSGCIVVSWFRVESSLSVGTFIGDDSMGLDNAVGRLTVGCAKLGFIITYISFFISLGV